MALESGTYISDLVITNPPTTDSKQQGDDHIRLIKTVLKNTFPNASRPVTLPSALYIGVGPYGVQASHQNMTFLMDSTAGQVDLYMPTLSAADAGWQCSAMKYNWSNANPCYIRPPSGTIFSGECHSLPYARRAIPGHRFTIFWSGSIWFVERVPRVAVGTVLPYQGGSLPIGYEWPNGQTLNPTLYPEWNAFVRGGGSTMDHRGRVSVMADQGVGRIGTGYAGGLNSSGYGGEGGFWIHQLTGTELPSHAHSTATYDPGHGHNFLYDSSPVGSLDWHGASSQGNPGSGNRLVEFNGHTLSIQGSGTGITMWDGVSQNVTYPAGGSAYHNNMQPTIVEHHILVVE